MHLYWAFKDFRLHALNHHQDALVLETPVANRLLNIKLKIEISII